MSGRTWLSMAAAWLVAGAAWSAPTEAELKTAVEKYFGDLFKRMEQAAAQQPTDETFRTVMKPHLEGIEGLYGSTLINADWEIRAVYFKSHFLAVGFSLRKVKELDYFRDLMAKAPAPQLSEPGHGSLAQPRLVALRYPVLKDGKMSSIVSLMVRTDAFLEAVKLDTCSAYKFVCLGKDAESKGTLSASHKEVKVSLPSTEWVIQYE